MPNLTSTAGRHAADRERARATQAAADAQDLVNEAARETLRRAIAAHGIRVVDALVAGRHELHVRCGVETCAAESALVDAIITDHGFRLDPTRISRFRERFEFVRLANTATGAKVEVVISRPGSLTERAGEAA